MDAVADEIGMGVEDEDEQEGVIPESMLGICAAALPTATTTAGKSGGKRSGKSKTKKDQQSKMIGKKVNEAKPKEYE